MVSALWRFGLENPRTGKRRGFADLEKMMAFLRGEFGGGTNPSGECRLTASSVGWVEQRETQRPLQAGEEGTAGSVEIQAPSSV